MRAASNYWLATVGPDGRPHARPVDGVWVDGALCVGGLPETRWVRNLMANPLVSVNLSSEAEAIILEGIAELVTEASHPLAAPSMAAASKAKSPQYCSAASRHSARSGCFGRRRRSRGRSRDSRVAPRAGRSTAPSLHQ
jgi:hypothetical protein